MPLTPQQLHALGVRGMSVIVDKSTLHARVETEWGTVQLEALSLDKAAEQAILTLCMEAREQAKRTTIADLRAAYTARAAATEAAWRAVGLADPPTG